MTKEEMKTWIAKRAAAELHDGDIATLGIGIPTLIPSYLPEDVHLTLHIDNGVVDVGVVTEENKQPRYIIDAGGAPSAINVGGCFMDSASIFSMIRGGHIDVAVLGALQVDAHGNLSNWMIPGKFVPGMGGAMDLVAGAKRVIIAMEHTNKGNPKIMADNTLPYTAKHCVDLIITEMGVMKITPDGIVLTEYNPAFTVEEIQAATDATLIISPDLQPML
jgi:acetate CoA/acetoacetate CoA-transferase beta subunit